MAIIEPWPHYQPPYNIWLENKSNYSVLNHPNNIITFYGKSGNVHINIDTWEVTYPEGITIPEVTKTIFDSLKNYRG